MDESKKQVTQITLDVSSRELVDDAANFRGFKTRVAYVRYCARRDLEEKKKNEVEELKRRNQFLKDENLAKSEEILKLQEDIATFKGSETQ